MSTINSYMHTVFLMFTIMGAALGAENQNNTPLLPVQYEELTAVQFKDALQKSAGTVIIPLGILEKHGAHLPLGTDLLDVRELSIRAAKEEYTIVFPPYYFGQIFEAKHQPGTIAYSHELIWNLLQETCDELSRNGFRKIILVNGHGGNNSFLPYFCQAQLENRRDYAIYWFRPAEDQQLAEKINKLRKTKLDGHAGEEETSTMLTHHPDLVHLDAAKTQSGEDQARLKDLENAYVGIWWYAKFPNHYAGDASYGNKELGELIIKGDVQQLVKMIRSVKTDHKTLELQNQFFNESENPLKTKQ